MIEVDKSVPDRYRYCTTKVDEATGKERIVLFPREKCYCMAYGARWISRDEKQEGQEYEEFKLWYRKPELRDGVYVIPDADSEYDGLILKHIYYPWGVTNSFFSEIQYGELVEVDKDAE